MSTFRRQVPFTHKNTFKTMNKSRLKNLIGGLLIACFTSFVPTYIFAQVSERAKTQSQIDIESAKYEQIAQRQLDSSSADLALGNALRAEELLTTKYNTTHPKLAYVLCLQGISYQKNGMDSMALTCLQRASAMSSSASPIDQAHIHFFDGYCMQKIMANDSAAEQSYQKAIDQYLLTPLPNGLPHQNAARAQVNIGYILYQKNEFEEALERLKIGENWFTQIHGTTHPNVAHSYNIRGLLYWKLGKYNEALQNYDKAYQIRKLTLKPDHAEIGASINNIALIYIEKGLFENARIWFDSAYQIGINAKNEELIATSHSNLGLVASKAKDYKTALKHFKDNLQIEENRKKPDLGNIITSIMNIGIAYKDLGTQEEHTSPALDSALVYYNKALSILNGIGYTELSELLDAFGVVYLAKKDYKKAKPYFRNALNSKRTRLAELHPSMTSSYFNLAKIAQAEDHYPEALSLNDSAQYALGLTTGSSVDESDSFIALGHVLLQRNQLQWTNPNNNNNTDSLKNLLLSCEKTFSVFAKAALILREKADRFELQNDVFSVFEIAIDANLKLWKKTSNDQYLNTAFALLEKSKAKEQLKSINITNARSINGIDSTLLQKERELQLAISYQDQLVDSTPKASVAGREARSNRYQLIEQHDLLMQEFALKNKVFSKATVQIKWLQDSFLTPLQTMLEYFVGDSNIYLFVIKKDLCYPLTIPKGRLAYRVEQLTQRGIYGYYPVPDAQKTETLKKTVSNYTEAAVALYDLLLDDVKDGLSPELIIIPDGVLNYIPFDALLPDAPLQPGKFFTYQFLADKHQISYCYSATMLREMRDKRHQKQPINEVLGMAPFFMEGTTAPIGTQYNTPSNGTFEHLYYSDAELKKIALYFPGKAFYFGANASKSIFQNQAEHYRILHLSTHGEANDRNGDYSFLVFEQLAGEQKYAKLLASELYPMRLNADLVVLSACETGLGKQLRGEGIVGLSRVFSIVGAKSLVVSLWKVDSEKNATIMGDFYKYLAQKKSKDEALYLAKRDYLTNKKNEYGGRECHPFFWASFIPVGDCRALEIKN